MSRKDPVLAPPKETFWTQPLKAQLTQGAAIALVFAAIIGVGLAVIFAIAAVGSLLQYESTFEWWLGAYAMGGLIVGGLSAVACFFGVWYLASERWGALAFVFGWLPSFILAWLTLFIVGALYGVALLVLVSVWLGGELIRDLRGNR